MRSITYYPRELILRSLKYILVYFTGAPKWHVATTYNKDYSKAVISYLNNLPSKYNSVAEIGCGTCDILRSLKHNKKDGYDMDKRVLSVARVMNTLFFSNIKLYQYDFIKNKELVWNYDIVILINWTHEVESAILKNRLNVILDNMSVDGKIIIDMVKKRDYKYNHTIEQLFSYDEIEAEVIFSNSIRNIYAINKLASYE